MIAYWTNYYRLSMDSKDSSQKTRQLQIENRPINVSVPTHLDTGFGQFGALRQFLQIKSKVQVKLKPLIIMIPLLTLSHPLPRPHTPHECKCLGIVSVQMPFPVRPVDVR